MAKKAVREPGEKEPKLATCKYCQAKLETKDRKINSKKRVGERLTFWGGREFIVTKSVQITCPNPECGKRYTIRVKGSEWLYK